MSQKDNISDKYLREEAPILFGLERKALKTPDGYFDKLADEVLAKVEEQETASVVDLNKARPAKAYIWAMAAGIAVITGLFIIGSNDSDLSEENLLADMEVSIEEDVDYLLEIDEETIIETYLAEVSSESESEEIEYLMDEDFDYEDYINVDL